LAAVDERSLDDGTASRLLYGHMPVDDAPRAHQGTARAVAALTAPPHPHELAAQREAVKRLAIEGAEQARLKARRDRQLLIAKRIVQVGASCIVACTVLLGSLAAANALP